MQRGQLSDYFEGVVVKRLSAVETTPAISNQHEFNGSEPLKRLLGESDRKDIPTSFIWLGQEQESISVEDTLSWYDARRRHPTRTEFRLYYPTNVVTDLMEAGDVFFLAMKKDGAALVIIAPSESTILSQLLWLFGLDSQPELQFEFREIVDGRSAELDFAARVILDELGIEPEEPEADRLDALIEPFGLVFPSTKTFSDLARRSLPDVSARDNPDSTLLEWMEREEQLFKRLERRIVSERLLAGFHIDEMADVEGFLHFSLSMQNRRKARAGAALESHLECVFNAHELVFVRGAETENRKKPDFLFPSQAAYHDPKFPPDRLVMLGSKSTLKDRWRQVLSEADRIPSKHLLTLEPSISENQTDEMRSKNLQLVVPRKIHESYKRDQRAWLMGLDDFIGFVKAMHC